MSTISRRSLLAMAAAAIPASAAKKKIPVGLEMYSVRGEMQKDLMGAIKAVAKAGYQGMEFYAPYMQWTPEKAKDVRKLMDDLNVKCFSTHNGVNSFSGDGMKKAIELNTILGSKFVIMASAGRVNGLDGWKGIADLLNKGAEGMKPAGIGTGFHNHQLEFKPIDGTRPMEILAKNTDKSVTLQLDVGTCIEAGLDPVVWIKQNPGRIRSMHCKDWSPEKDKGYKVLFGEGVAKWKEIFKTAEKVGGVQCYLVEQEGSRFPEYETAEKCLVNFRKIYKG